MSPSSPTARLSLDHVALPAHDAAVTRAFYGDLLGLSLSSAMQGDDWEGHRWLMMVFADADDRQLAFFVFEGLQAELDREWPLDTRHYAFSVAGMRELSAWKAKLDDAGVAWREEDHGQQLSIYFEDPSGTVLEITTYRESVGAEGRATPDAIVDAWIANEARIRGR